MAWNSVQGVPDYQSNFIPDIFAAKVLKNFYQNTCLSDITNTDYQGEITGMGSKVIVRRTPQLTVKDYQPNQDLDYEVLTPETVELYIDKAKWFGCSLDQIFAKQFDKNYQDLAAADGAIRLKEAIEEDFFAYAVGAAHADNQGSTAGVSGSYSLGVTGTAVALVKGAIGTANGVDLITQAGAVVTEQGVPQAGRWIVLPSWAVRLIKMDPLLNDAAATGDPQSVIRKGAVGVVDRFTVYENNLLPTETAGATTICPFGTKEACTFATQLTNNEVLPNPRTFGTLMRSLNVYGYKVVQPKALGVMYIDKS